MTNLLIFVLNPTILSLSNALSLRCTQLGAKVFWLPPLPSLNEPLLLRLSYRFLAIQLLRLTRVASLASCRRLSLILALLVP